MKIIFRNKHFLILMPMLLIRVVHSADLNDIQDEGFNFQEVKVIETTRNHRKIDLSDPLTYKQVEAVLHNHGQSIELVGEEAAIRIFKVWQEIDANNFMDELATQKVQKKVKKKKKKKKKTENTSLVSPRKSEFSSISSQLLIDERQKNDELWTKKQLNKIKEAADKFISECLEDFKDPLLLRKEITSSAQEDRILQSIHISPQSHSLDGKKEGRNKERTPKKHKKKLQDLISSSVIHKSEEQSLKNNSVNMAKEETSSRQLEYGQVRILKRDHNPIFSPTNLLEVLPSQDDASNSLTEKSITPSESQNEQGSNSTFSYLYNYNLATQPVSLPIMPFVNNVYLPMPYYYPVSYGVPYRPTNVYPYGYNPYASVIVSGKKDQDFKVSFYNEFKRKYENVEPGIFTSEQHPQFEEIKKILNKDL